MNIDRLIEKLRIVTGFIRFETGDRIAAASCLSEEAADAIEAQRAEIERLKIQCETLDHSVVNNGSALKIDIETYYATQVEWSRNTFGPALRTKGIINHITKELREIEAKPHDLSEWVDVIMLAMDGFWRHGGKPEDLMPSMLAKQAKNMARTWPDWRGINEDTAIEHDRSILEDTVFDEEGFTIWTGGDRPVDGDVIVAVKVRGAIPRSPIEAKAWPQITWRWRNTDDPMNIWDIVAYKVLKKG
jgi:hypothetical protein